MSASFAQPRDAGPRTGPEALPAVVVDRLSKSFRLPHRRYSTFKERALHPFQASTYDVLHAVDDVSFEVARGEFFGIVGRNGSGKSTLLKCLARIYEPNGGQMEVNGRLSPFIELGVGFNPDLTARDNVIINAVMLGLSRREARRRFDEIIDFAELHEFLDLKLKNYSSGMSVRLGFAVAVQVDADVLLVDEVLAVGDAAFQQKCFDEFHRLKADGRTVILVTHDMAAVERFCDRAMLLDRGAMAAFGAPRDVARAYNELNFGTLVHTELESEHQGDGQICEIEDAWFECAGEPVAAIAQGHPLTLVTRIRFHADQEDPIFAATLRNEVGHTVFSTSTQWQGVATGLFAAGEVVEWRAEVVAWFAQSQYSLSPSVARNGAGADALDLREDMATILVHAIHQTGGIVDLPHTHAITRA